MVAGWASEAPSGTTCRPVAMRVASSTPIVPPITDVATAARKPEVHDGELDGAEPAATTQHEEPDDREPGRTCP